jgi:hypothetical protein
VKKKELNKKKKKILEIKIKKKMEDRRNKMRFE